MKKLITTTLAITIFSFAFAQLPISISMKSDQHRLGSYVLNTDTVKYDFINDYNVDILLTKDTIFIYDKNNIIKLSSIGLLEEILDNNSKSLILFCKDAGLGLEGENCRFVFGYDKKTNTNFAILTNLDKFIYFNISKTVSIYDCEVNDFIQSLSQYEYDNAKK